MSDRHKHRTLMAKRTVDYIRNHPEGVTVDDFKRDGVPMMGMDRLLKLNLVKGYQIREPERGPRNYHWLWKSATQQPTTEPYEREA